MEARVRILIISAVGAGKTTILQKICDQTDTPIVRDSNGQEITDLASLEPATARGLHDIDLEITYPSQPGFVFHDSRGPGDWSTDGLNLVHKFLVQRARKKGDAVHIVWYCVSTDSSRPLVSVERQFFEQISA
ncbi:hypothetical protein FRB94_010742, partial [Tulasnella sp. JGI-2019a]